MAAFKLYEIFEIMKTFIHAYYCGQEPIVSVCTGSP